MLHSHEASSSLPCALVIDIAAGDASETLCPFLGVPVPDAPFPHANTREDMAPTAGSANSSTVRDNVSALEERICVDEGRRPRQPRPRVRIQGGGLAGVRPAKDAHVDESQPFDH